MIMINKIIGLFIKKLNSTPEDLVSECNKVVDSYNSSIDLLIRLISANNYTIDSITNNINNLKSDNILKENQILGIQKQISMENEIIAIIQKGK